MYLICHLLILNRYDIDLNEWTDIMTPEVECTAPHSSAVVMIIHCINKQMNKFTGNSSLVSFDPTTNSWRSSVSRSGLLYKHLFVFVYKDVLHVIGIFLGDGAYPNKIERYDVNTQTFSLVCLSTFWIIRVELGKLIPSFYC